MIALWLHHYHCCLSHLRPLIKIPDKNLIVYTIMLLLITPSFSDMTDLMEGHMSTLIGTLDTQVI